MLRERLFCRVLGFHSVKFPQLAQAYRKNVCFGYTVVEAESSDSRIVLFSITPASAVPFHSTTDATQIFEELLAASVEIIEPPVEDVDDYSGKFVARIPKELHRDLVEAAKLSGTSLNQYIVYALTRFKYSNINT